MAKPENFPVFLKGIHIQGFKSFADRVRLELRHGLSVIVGPNGSGKSNVADAVRWVLGEQSVKSLRGVKMEDVIFAGSNHRRPVGMAEVSLVFDNTTGIFPLEFQEVTITRRVYRDGEGQYLINNTTCRLKDIQELFMDTGAGKEGFSIIGQGRVEEILNLKSEERRSLIEEASGISKYRFRKREALKRLDATEMNLQRIEDILREIEGQLTPLAAQAQVAEKSLALAAEQKSLEIQWVVLDIAEVKQKLTAARQESEDLQASLVEVQALLGHKETQELVDKLKLKKSDEIIQEMQGEVFRAEQSLNALKHDRSLRTERFGYFNEQITRMTKEIVEDEQKIINLQERLKTLTAKKAVLKQTVKESLSRAAGQEQKLSELKANNPAKETDQIKANLFEALAEQANCSNELTGASQMLASLEQQIQQAELKQREKQQERQSLNETLLSQEEELVQAAEKIQTAHQEQVRLKSESDIMLRQRQEQNRELQKLRNQIDQSGARLNALQSLEDSLEGYQRGVREVMLAKKKGKVDCQGLCGTAADLISVQEEYELALETALGGGVQDVVAIDEQSAKKAIAYLKTHQFGRVTFLPLDVIQGNRITVSKAVEGDSGYIGLAVDLIRYDELYRPAMEFLLGRILVVKDMDAATSIAKASGYRQRIVTLEGDQVHPGGSLSGGSVPRRGGNLLGRSREIETLRAALLKLEGQSAEKDQEVHRIDTRQLELQERINYLERQRREDNERQVELRAVQENLHNQLRRLDEDLVVLNLRSEENISQKDELNLQLTSITERLAKAEETSRMLREQFNRQEEQAKSLAGEIEGRSEELTQEKIRLAKWEQELAQCVEQIGQEQAIILENETNLGQKKQNLSSVQQTSQSVAEELRDLAQKLEEHSLSQEKRQYDLMQCRQDRESLSKGVAELEQEVLAKRQEAHGLEERFHANEMSAVRWETEWQAGLNRLTEEFSLTWEGAQSYQTKEEKVVLRRKIQSLKQQIQVLGPINQAAIEEYPRLLKRQEFMLAQQNDLIIADQTLHQLIAELDKTMSERFNEGFKAVNDAFQEVFKELFHGGNAELRLEDPEHLLETGVEIIAQPPGKKPQLLSLLSGGERALTAIALLFALLRVKPSPFCILDEIEASLDDANVQRFAQYIHRLAHSTQFVVISHRKGTMESADVLYGIAMEESGVSKLLSVQLEERAGLA